jgi:2,3-bisphosphoglycerate-independent phosphoglycerate mutase
MTANKVLLLILDGVSDRPCPELSGKTPLEAAATPVLDGIARSGISGIMDTIAPGIRPGSDTAHLSLLGYPPEKYYTGRGPLEAEGAGIHMEPGMIGFRCNFATVDRQGLVADRRAGRIQATKELTAAIQNSVDLSSFGVEFFFRSGAGHRAALAFRGEGLGHCVSSNDPKHEGIVPAPVRPLRTNEADERTARTLRSFLDQSAEILEAHPLNQKREASGLPPANIVLVRGAGEMGRFEPFSERYGMSGSVISAASLISGIGRVVGLRHIPVEGATGATDSNIEAKVSAAVRELETRDFILLNIKGADEAGHDGYAIKKRDFITRLDPALAPLLRIHSCLIVVCADHSTPCMVRDHSADPVPVMISGEGVRTDGVERFGERSCAHGGLHRIRGQDLMPIILDLIGRSHKYGA